MDLNYLYFHYIAISLYETQHLKVLSNHACIYVLPKPVAKHIETYYTEG